MSAILKFNMSRERTRYITNNIVIFNIVLYNIYGRWVVTSIYKVNHSHPVIHSSTMEGYDNLYSQFVSISNPHYQWLGNGKDFDPIKLTEQLFQNSVVYVNNTHIAYINV